MNEFRLVCQMNGLPVEDARQRVVSHREVQINPQYGLQLSRKSQKQINNFCDQLYTSYLALYNQFKKSHQSALQNNYASQEQYKKHMHESNATNKNPYAPDLHEYNVENQVRTDRHKQIIKELIELSQKTPGTLLNQYASAINGQKYQQIGTPVQPKYKSYSPIKGRSQISESSETPKDDNNNKTMKSVRLEFVSTTNPTKFQRKPQGQAETNTNASQKKNQFLNGSLDQESILREKKLENERFSMINIKWSSDFREDKDLILREEPKQMAQLRHRYIKRTQELEQAREEMQKIKEIDLASRLDANREISQHRQVHDNLTLINKGKKPQIMNKWFDIQIFDVTKGLKLDPDVQTALDTKIKTLTNTYEGKLKVFTAKCEILEEQMALMNKVNSEHIKPHELTMEKLIELLARIEEVRSKNARRIIESDPYTGQLQVTKRPPEIWKKFHECFGPDYFLECIEEEYGNSQGSYEQIITQITRFFNNEIQKFKDIQTSMIKEKNLEVEKYTRQLDDKNEEIAGLRRKQDLLNQELIKKTKENLNTFYQEREANFQEAFQKEKQALTKQIEILHYQRDNQWRTQNAIIKIHAIKRWQMFTLIRNLMDKNKECCLNRFCIYAEDQQNIPEVKRRCLRATVDEEMRKRIESFMKEQCLMLRESKQAGIPVELHSTIKLINEIKEIKQEWTQDKFLLTYYKNGNILQQQTIQEMRLNIEDLNKKRDFLINSQPQVINENENLILCNNELKKQMQLQLNKIDMLERRWASGASVAQQMTVKNLMQAMEIKAANSFAEYAFTASKAPKHGLAIPTRNLSMQTEINNLDFNITQFQKTDQQKNAETQTDRYMIEMCTQTLNLIAEATTQTPGQAMTFDAEIQCCLIESREKLVEQMSPTSSPQNNQNIRESIRPSGINRIKTQKTQKANVIKSFGVGSQVGGMLTVSKMTHAISNPADKPKAFQEPMLSKRVTKIKSKGVSLKEKADVISSKSSTRKQDLSEMEEYEGNFPGFKKIDSNRYSFKNGHNLKQSVHTNNNQREIKNKSRGTDKDKLPSDSKYFSSGTHENQKSVERPLLKKQNSSENLQKNVKVKERLSKLEAPKLANNKNLRLLNSHHSSQRFLFKQNNLLKRSEIVVSQEAAPTSRSPDRKGDSFKETTEDISKIVGQKQESDLTSELEVESQMILNSSGEKTEGKNLKQENGSNNGQDDNFQFQVPLKKLEAKKLGTVPETTRRSFSYQSKGSSIIRQIDNQINADILSQNQPQALTSRHDPFLVTNRDSAERLHSARVFQTQKTQDTPQFMPMARRDQFKKAEHHPIPSIDFNRKDPIRMPLSYDQRAPEALNESIQSFEFGSRPKIQQLLLKGLISEEQFITLQLLEKGALLSQYFQPAQNNTERIFSEQSYNTFNTKQSIPISNTLYQEQQKHFKFQGRQLKSTASQVTHHSDQKNDFRNKSQLNSFNEQNTNANTVEIQIPKTQNIAKPPKFLKFNKDKTRRSQVHFKVVPTNKIQVLEKIFDKVFKPKHDMETQLDYQNTSFDRTFKVKSNAQSIDMINLKGIGSFQRKKRKFKKFNDICSKSQKDFNELPPIQSCRQLY